MVCIADSLKGMASGGRRDALTDPIALRAIAHPTRNRILEELEAGGQLRAADVARTLGIPANQASYHLRLLAKYGLVEDAEAGRDKRDRVWRLTDERGLRIQPSVVATMPGGSAAVRVWRRSAAQRAHELVDQAYGPLPEGHQRVVGDLRLRLTAEEAQQLGEELMEVGHRWTARTRGRRIEQHQTYAILAIVQPVAPPPEPSVST
jgi:DNA-binding transcriptional ArsR family regulator